MISRDNKHDEGARPGVFIAVVLVLAACAVGGLVFWKRNASPSAPQTSEQDVQPETPGKGVPSASPDEGMPVLVTNEPMRPAASGRAQLTVKRAPAAANSIPARPEPSPMSRFLVNNIVNLDKAGVPKTPEQIAAWKQGLKD